MWLRRQKLCETDRRPGEVDEPALATDADGDTARQSRAAVVCAACRAVIHAGAEARVDTA